MEESEIIEARLPEHFITPGLEIATDGEDGDVSYAEIPGDLSNPE